VLWHLYGSWVYDDISNAWHLQKINSNEFIKPIV
jgi:hypothetical protein